MEGFQKDLKANVEVLKLDNLNTIHSLKSVTENVKKLTKRIEEGSGNRPQPSNQRNTRELNELRIELESLKRQQELRENKIKRSPKIGNIREFCARTESEHLSSNSGKKLKFKELKDIKPIHVREFRLDSSLSQAVRPLELLRDKNIMADWESDNSSVKTSNKKDIGASLKIPEFRNFFEDDANSQSNKKTPVKTNPLANVKDFDDFKFLLKDLKMTLNMSDFSSFQDNLNDQMAELEKVLGDYSELDKKIIGLVDGQSDTLRLNNSLFENGLNGGFDNKRSKSVKFKGANGNKYMKELEELKIESNFNQYHIKLKDLKNNPFDFESFIFKVKKEFGARKRKFEDIQEFIV